MSGSPALSNWVAMVARDTLGERPMNTALLSATRVDGRLKRWVVEEFFDVGNVDIDLVVLVPLKMPTREQVDFSLVLVGPAPRILKHVESERNGDQVQLDHYGDVYIELTVPFWRDAWLRVHGYLVERLWRCEPETGEHDRAIALLELLRLIERDLGEPQLRPRRAPVCLSVRQGPFLRVLEPLLAVRLVYDLVPASRLPVGGIMVSGTDSVAQIGFGLQVRANPSKGQGPRKRGTVSVVNRTASDPAFLQLSHSVAELGSYLPGAS